MIPQNPTQLFHLAATGELRPADSAEPTMPAQVSGLPAFYYWKDAIVVGSYIHPARGFSLDITRDRLDGYVANFNRMQTNGIGVPILMDHAPTASATLGWIVDVKRDGDRLMELHQFLGESARDTGLRNKVSLGIDPNFIDGKGTAYGEAIVHSAVTPVPVVPHQGEFEAVTFSDDDDAEIITLSLATAPDGTDTPRETARAEPETTEFKTAVEPYSATSSQGPEARVTTTASTTSASTISADTMHLAIQALEQVAIVKRDLALSRGAIDPAVADELFDLLIKPQAGSANTLLFSRTTNGPSIAVAVFDALSRNRPAPLGEITSLQVLSRATPGEDNTDLRQRMIALASGKA